MKFSTIQISGSGPSTHEAIEQLDISLVKCSAKCVALLCRTPDGTFIYPEGPQDTDLWFGLTMTFYSPQEDIPDNIVLGFKGSTMADAGCVYAPYVPIHKPVAGCNFNIPTTMRLKYGLQMVNKPRIIYPAIDWLYNQHEVYEAIRDEDNQYRLGEFKLPSRYAKYKPNWDQAITLWAQDISAEANKPKSENDPYGTMTIISQP